MMIEIKLITNENLDYAVRIQNEIFPEYNGEANYIKSIENSKQSQFFLAMDKGICVGITGIYSYKNDDTNAWLGFFGVIEKYRKKGYGKKVLRATEKYAKNKGYQYMRLFTDRLDNNTAINFYENNGYSFEDYNCDLEELKNEFDVIIGSKSLCDYEAPLWDNKFINISKQIRKQQYVESVQVMGDDTSSAIEDPYTEEEFYFEERKLKHKEKKELKRINKYLAKPDIKYVGILSYRHLRILAWIALAISQFCLVISIGQTFIPDDTTIYPNWFFTVLKTIGYYSIPFFLLASFSLILSRNRSYKSTVLFYGIAYIGIALGIIFVYDRYIGRIIYEISESRETAKNVVLSIFNMKTDFNVFGDLFILSLFNFFLNYELKNCSKKKVIGFRLLAIIPLNVALVSYILLVLARSEIISLPFEVYPFLTTKSPLIYLVFVCMSLWIKNRERIFVKLGATKKEYNEFLRTNRNSLSFSINVCLLFLLVSILDLILLSVIPNGSIYSLGQAVGLFLSIPFILLFSYNKTHKDKTIDLILPFIGIVLIILAYAEAIYEIILAIV